MNKLQVLDLEVDLDNRRVCRGGAQLELPDLSYSLLVTLIRHAPHTVSKDELIAEVWDGVVVSDETLAQRARLLRQALDDTSRNPRYFTSIRGKGYRLLAPVETAEDSTVPTKISWQWISAIFACVALVLGIFLSRAPERGNAETTALQAVAVLPFEDLSPENDHQYFADGMQEELLSRLARVSDLRVVSRTSVERFRDSNYSVPRIANMLSVSAVIEGSVRIVGDQVRVTVQLIDAGTDSHIWVESFDRELSVASVFSIQDEVAAKVANSLRLTYRLEEQVESSSLPTSNLQAYESYLLGRQLTFQQTPEDLDRAVNLLQEAIELDPEFAEAYATLGWALSFQGTLYGGKRPKQVYPLAKDASLQALLLDDELSDARTLYADILTWFDWDFVAAEREYRRTLELDDSNVLGYALYLSVQERHAEALELIEQRLQEAPFDSYVHINAAWRYLDARNYERALEEAEAAADHVDSSLVISRVHVATGNPGLAIALMQDELLGQGRSIMRLANLAIAYYQADRQQEGDLILAELQQIRQSRYFSPGLLAPVYFAKGDPETGFTLLQEAAELRAREVLFIRTDSSLDGYRDHPQYLQLLRTVGFTAD